MDLRNITNYVVNLKQHPQKYKRAERNLSLLGIYPKRFEAVYAKNLSRNYIKEITYPSVDYFITNGRDVENNIGTLGGIGCFLSHLKLWEMLVQSKEEMFLIFEDDIAQSSYTIHQLNQFVSDVAYTFPNWDVILLGYIPRGTTDIQVTPHIQKVDKINFGTHAYLITRRGAEKLIKNALPIVDQVDSYMSFMAFDRIHTFRGNQPFFNQNNEEGSDIQVSQLPKLIFLQNQFENNNLTDDCAFYFILITLPLMIYYLYRLIKMEKKL